MQYASTAARPIGQAVDTDQEAQMSRMSTIAAGLAAAMPWLTALPANAAALPDKFNPAEFAKPKVCNDHYKLDAANGLCKPPAEAELATLGEAACKAASFTYDSTAKACKPGSATAVAAQCQPISGMKSKLAAGGTKDAACTYDNAVAASAASDYIGDCFRITTVPSNSGLQAGRQYFVSGQRNVTETDRELTLTEGGLSLWRRGAWIPTWGCKPTGDASSATYTVSAAALMEAGAYRSGYTWGLLTMPYKYYPGEKSFVAGLPIGAYLGWRNGVAGSGSTVAAALTLGQVKADTVDPSKPDANGKPTVTGKADVAALSLALGVMYDLLKSPAGKPFKAGLFVGADVVSRDPTVSYRFNRKPWVAVQLGYDFTDN